MLDSLVSVINTLKERIRAHRGELEENETRTRMALIDPLLTVLGWDTSDPGCVKPEYPVTGGKADYGLRNAGPTPAAFIEAKKLGEPLESHREQMTRYSNMAGVKYAGLTNGDRWELYEVFSPASLDERRILDLSILNDPPHQSALKLLLLWRPNLESGAPIPANEPVLEERPSDAAVIDRPATPPSPAPSSAPMPSGPAVVRASGATPAGITIYWGKRGRNDEAILLEQRQGRVWLKGQEFSSPSGACKDLTNGAYNGWDEWEYDDRQTQRRQPITGLRGLSDDEQMRRAGASMGFVRPAQPRSPRA